jgi:hypothetical protein
MPLASRTVFYGLSTQTKPAAASFADAVFFELDSGRWYAVANSQWVLARTESAQPVYGLDIPSQVHVAVADTVHWDLFNASNAQTGVLLRVLSIRQIPDVTQVVTGVPFNWKLQRTTAVGTGGAALTPYLADLSQAALDAGITARSKPTGGATAGVTLRNFSLSSEETDAGSIQLFAQGGLELLPAPLLPANGGRGLVLRPTQGVRVDQVTNSAAGNTGWHVAFTSEPL